MEGTSEGPIRESLKNMVCVCIICVASELRHADASKPCTAAQSDQGTSCEISVIYYCLATGFRLKRAKEQ
jgi:hypothetical protein